MVYVDCSPSSDLNHNFPVYEQLSRILPGDERIHENILVPEPITGPPCQTVKTVYDCLLRGKTLSEDGHLFGEISNNPYEWISYGELISDAQILGSAMIHLGLEKCQRVGIAGIQNTRYLKAMHGMVSYSMTIVPLYHNSKIDNLCDIIRSCELKLIFCDTIQRCQDFLERIQELPSVETLVLLKDEDVVPNSDHVKIISYADFYKIGKENLVDVIPPQKDDIYLICHTSGTTGTPKGVMLSHGNILAAMAGLYTQWVLPPNRFHFDHNDVYFSFLSLAHVYEHLMQTFVLYIGGSIGFYNGNIAQMVSNIKLLHPTIVSLVPRLLNRFYDHIHNEVNKKNVLKKSLFQLAKKRKLALLATGIQRYDTIWDQLVFNKLRPLLGGRLRMITTGGAPVTSAVKNFTRIAYGCPLMEGYGQTECGAAATLNLPFEYVPGVVGAPAPCSQCKLVDVPELGYMASEDKGEICFRGAAVMKGYFNDEELTAKTIDEEGWLHTGDIGHWHANGTLAVIDRKNALFKMSQGDFVSPEQIEAVYLNCPLLTQIFVTGRTERSFLVGIGVVNINNIRQTITERSEFLRLKELSDNELINDASVVTLVLQELVNVGKRHGLQTIEQIRHLALTQEEWTAETNLVTPTLKLRRHLLRVKYSPQIDNLYDKEVEI